MFVVKPDDAGGVVDFDAEPDADAEQQQGELRGGTQQPRQRGDAQPPEQKGVAGRDER